MRNKENISIFLGGVQHFSLFEGESIRTTFYLKGCPMRCAWCCNPELHSTSHDLMYVADKCIGTNICGACLNICPKDAIYTTKENTIGIDRELCDMCGECFHICSAKALFGVGKKSTLPECLEIINKDRDFIDGVTLSGGEPFMRPKSTLALVEALVKENLSIAISTSGFFDLDNPNVVAILQKINTLYFDIKHVDSIKHKNGTGLDNTRILSNLMNILKMFPKLTCHTQSLIVPGYNDDKQSVQELALFLSHVSRKEHKFYFYHSFGEEKYTQLGRPCLYTNRTIGKQLKTKQYREIFDNYNITLDFD